MNIEQLVVPSPEPHLGGHKPKVGAAPPPVAAKLPLTTVLVRFIERTLCGRRTISGSASLIAASRALEGFVNPGVTTGVSILSAPDGYDQPQGAPLHTLYGTGGNPNAPCDTSWNLMVPAVIEFSCLCGTEPGNSRRFHQIILIELQER
ncbi:hypothetical protein CYMTET_53412 [Cymbomonas tetramitiformis]|uniref:Uncharacterized protein n=1 Tax=Cymbomonas tetramitiformis TaxID=36881 RepID=A0AAE0BI43_9CHLO|nr:hypothetical protein CYMTET_53412 [Cymbomonas tetramitiformis]